MAANLVLGHNGSRPVLPRLAEYTVKHHAAPVVAVEKQSHSVELGHRGWARMEKHSTEVATSHGEVPEVAPWAAAEVLVVPVVDLVVARRRTLPAD